MNEPSADLKALMPFIMQSLRDLYARSEAMRCLLENAEPFSVDGYERCYKDALKEWDEKIQHDVDAAFKTGHNEVIQRVLEKYARRPH